MDLSPQSLIKILKERGYELDRVRGSHHLYVNKQRKHSVSVPIHGNKDLKLGTYKAILKQSDSNTQ